MRSTLLYSRHGGQNENLIGVPTVRSAAKTWYQRDKESGAQCQHGRARLADLDN